MSARASARCRRGIDRAAGRRHRDRRRGRLGLLRLLFLRIGHQERAGSRAIRRRAGEIAVDASEQVVEPVTDPEGVDGHGTRADGEAEQDDHRRTGQELRAAAGSTEHAGAVLRGLTSYGQSTKQALQVRRHDRPSVASGHGSRSNVRT